MKYNIAAFTDRGSERLTNQDRVLVNGTVCCHGSFVVTEADSALCFLCDGMAGTSHGWFSADYVMEQICKQFTMANIFDKAAVQAILSSINHDLLKECAQNQMYLSSATTLVGIALNNDNIQVINVGDSKAWLLREKENIIFLSQDHNTFGKDSRVTSYFGGMEDSLEPDIGCSLREIMHNDILILNSDGLTNALAPKNEFRTILQYPKPLEERAHLLLQTALEKGAKDNISCILIEVIKDE